jgi:hypothetical protein
MPRSQYNAKVPIEEKPILMILRDDAHHEREYTALLPHFGYGHETLDEIEIKDIEKEYQRNEDRI